MNLRATASGWIDRHPRLYGAKRALRGAEMHLRHSALRRRYSAIASRVGYRYDARRTLDGLRERLARRGVRARPAGSLHLLYVSLPTPWEPHNLPPAVAAWGRVSVYSLRERGFDYESPDWLQRRDEAGRDLLGYARELHVEQPIDLALCYLSGWSADAALFDGLGRMGIVTCNFCLDDKLGFRGRRLGGRWTGPCEIAPAVDLSLTSSSQCCPYYELAGGRAMFWPEGANPEVFRPVDGGFDRDVSFVGSRFGYRPVLVDALRRAGISVEAFGRGWPGGRLSVEEMMRLYSSSRINLGHGGMLHSHRIRTLKGRDFEVPMSGGLYVTTFDPDLAACFEDGREIVFYEGPRDCELHVRELLSDRELAASIRRRGRARALRDHTWQRRIGQLLEWTGLLAPSHSQAPEAALTTA